MADAPKAPTPKAPAPKTAKKAEPKIQDSLTTFAQEYDEDRKIMRNAYIIALMIIIPFFFWKLPELRSQDPLEVEKPKVYVVQQVRFKPPPPKQQEKIPERKKKKVPIPDPTPDEPEPIRLPDEIEPEIDLPDTDLIFDIPDGPPEIEPDGPIQVGGDVLPPERTVSPPPQYTEIARKARVQGIVIVQAIINKQGNVTNVKILKGLGMGLDQAAIDAVKKWKFKPATLNGKPVDVYYNLTVNFKLQ